MKNYPLSEVEVEKLSQYKIKYDFRQVEAEGAGDYLLNYDGLTSEEVKKVDAIADLRAKICDYAEKKAFAEKPKLTFEEYVASSNFTRTAGAEQALVVSETDPFTGVYRGYQLRRRSVVEILRKRPQIQRMFAVAKEEEKRQYEGWNITKTKGFIQYAEEAKAAMFEEVEKAIAVLGKSGTEEVLDAFEAGFSAEIAEYAEHKKEVEEYLAESLEESIQEGEYMLYSDRAEAKQRGISEEELVRGDLVEKSEYDMIEEVDKNQLENVKMLKDYAATAKAEKEQERQK